MREQLNDSEQPARLTRYRSAITGSRAVLRILQAGSMADGAQRGMSPSLAAVVALVFAVVAVLPPSLLWLRYKRGVTGLCERLGLVRGKGLRVIVREGVLWSLPAIAMNLAYWPLLGQRVAESTQQVSQQPALMTLFAGSALTGVAVGCVAVPIVEELLYRGCSTARCARSTAARSAC